MRLLANENFPGDAIIALREAGHDVAWIRTDAPGISDSQVLDRARREERILLTFDKDFGEMAFRSRISSVSGIILFRLAIPSPLVAARIAVQTLSARTDWAGHFSVIEEHRIRMTSLPKS